LIGKNVKVSIDFIRPREGEFEERECVTVQYGGHNSCVNNMFFDSSTDVLSIRNIAEQLVEKGFASVMRHKRDDEHRSQDYDKLMAAEQTFVFLHLEA
jgi:staphylococcal nuclease domain-containing protein 1